MNLGTPMTPTPGPSIATTLSGWGVNPHALKTYTSFQDALSDPILQKLADPSWSPQQKADAQTNFLRDVYGLSGDYKVDTNGQFVESAPWIARNAWWLAPAAFVGGGALAAGIGGLGGGASAAGAASGAGGAGAGAGTLASTTLGSGFIPGVGLASGTTAAAVGGAAGGGGLTLADIFGMAKPSPWQIASPLIGQGIGALTNIWGANQQTDAANQAAAAQAAAAKYQADKIAEAAAAALQFQKDEAAQTQKNWLATNNANYDQWLAGANFDYGKYKTQYDNLAPYRGIGAGATQTIAGLLGVPMQQTAPAATWTPPANPFAGGGSGAPSGPAAAVDASKGDLAGQISAYFKSRGVSDSETPYWVQKWGEFGAKDPAYFNQRLAGADIFTRR
jgi:hypothetical protein